MEDNERSADWPDFNHKNYNRVFTPPSDNKIAAVFDSCFSLVLPFLKREVGRHLRARKGHDG